MERMVEGSELRVVCCEGWSCVVFWWFVFGGCTVVEMSNYFDLGNLGDGGM